MEMLKRNMSIQTRKNRIVAREKFAAPSQSAYDDSAVMQSNHYSGLVPNKTAQNFKAMPMD